MADNGYSKEEYIALVEEIEGKGAIADGDEIAKKGALLLGETARNQYAINTLANVPEAEKYFDDDKEQGVLLILIARSVLKPGGKELTTFIDWVEWRRDYGLKLDKCFWYLVGKTAESGRGRDDLVEALTAFRVRRYDGNGNKKANSGQSRKEALP